MLLKTKTVAISCAIAASAVMLGAPTASASDYCDSSGYTATGEPMQRCTKLSNGVLTHWKTYVSSGNSTNIYTRYNKTDGSGSVSVRLGYIYNGSTTYSSYFSISAGGATQKSWSKSGDYSCSSSTGVLNYSGGTYQTPSTHC